MLYVTLPLAAILWTHVIVFNSNCSDGNKVKWRMYSNNLILKLTTLPTLAIVSAILILITAFTRA